MKVGQTGAPETPGAKAKGKLDYFNATMGKLLHQDIHNLTNLLVVGKVRS